MNIKKTANSTRLLTTKCIPALKRVYKILIIWFIVWIINIRDELYYCNTAAVMVMVMLRCGKQKNSSETDGTYEEWILNIYIVASNERWSIERETLQKTAHTTWEGCFCKIDRANQSFDSYTQTLNPVLDFQQKQKIGAENWGEESLPEAT